MLTATKISVSQVCTARLLLLTPGRQGAPEPAHACPPLRGGLYWPLGASVKQPYYSYPEGGLSLLTGRHKYSSTSSPRVNGCPSGCSQPYRRSARLLLHTCGAGHFLSQRQGRLRGGTNAESQRKHIQHPVLERDPETLLSSGALFA